jgi:WD40 repeat protein
LPDEKHILTYSSDEVTRLWDITTGEQLSVLPDGISGVAVSYDGRFFPTYYSGNESRFWDLEDKIRKRILETNEGIICSSLSHDGRSFLTCRDDGTASLWNPQTGEELKRFIGHSDSVAFGTFSPDGRHILTGSNDGTARLWNTETGREVRVFGCKMISLVAFSPNGKFILTGSRDGTARLWPLPPQFWPRPQSTEATAP